MVQAIFVEMENEAYWKFLIDVVIYYLLNVIRRFLACRRVSKWKCTRREELKKDSSREEREHKMNERDPRASVSDPKQFVQNCTYLALQRRNSGIMKLA